MDFAYYRMKKLPNKNSVESLEYGLVLSSGLLAVMYVILCVLVLAISTLIVIMILVPESMIYGLVAIICALIVLCVLIYVIVYHHKLRSKIERWLRNAIPCNAVCNRDSSISMPYAPMRTGTKLRVEFEYDGKTLVRLSGRRSEGTKTSGYSWVFNKYVNRKIIVLYSPIYDQVLLPKIK